MDWSYTRISRVQARAIHNQELHHITMPEKASTTQRSSSMIVVYVNVMRSCIDQPFCTNDVSSFAAFMKSGGHNWFILLNFFGQPKP